MEFRKTKSSTLWLLGIILLGALLIQIPINGQSEEAPSVSFNVSKRMGTGIGDRIEGQFTLKGSSTGKIVQLIVYFNGNEVNKVDGSEIVFEFDTNNYPLGMTNITLVGIVETGVQVQSTEEWDFISPNVGYITIAVVVLVILPLSFYKKRRKREKKREKNSPNADKVLKNVEIKPM